MKVAGPFGGFDYRSGGGREQIWIAGDIGVTPFMSWIRSLASTGASPSGTRSRMKAAPSIDEIENAADHRPFTSHIVVSERDRRLTAEKVAAAWGSLSDACVFLSGPPPMTASLVKGFRRLGVPRSRLRWEQFTLR